MDCLNYRPIDEAHQEAQQACKCGPPYSPSECQILDILAESGDVVLECKPHAVEACRSAVGSFAEAYRNALDGHEPQCIEYGNFYELTQNLDASCNPPTAPTSLPSGK